MLAVNISHEVGSLSKFLNAIADAGINIKYMYGLSTETPARPSPSRPMTRGDRKPSGARCPVLPPESLETSNKRNSMSAPHSRGAYYFMMFELYLL